MSGVLFVVGVPIGNIEDITLRALRVLNSADLIAAEDTREALKLLNHYGLRNKLVSYHEHSGPQKERELVELIRGGANLALTSDAGMPGVSDPGARLIRLCAEAGIEVVAAPGPTAAATAVSLSAIGDGEFLFIGFPPSKGSERRKRLKKLAAEPRAMVFYEAPHRIIASLRDMLAVFGPRRAALMREMTKMFEETLRGGIDSILDELEGRDRVKGEITLVVQGAEPPDEPAVAAELEQAAARLTDNPRTRTLSRKDIKDILAAAFDCPRNMAQKALDAADEQNT